MSGIASSTYLDKVINEIWSYFRNLKVLSQFRSSQGRQERTWSTDKRRSTVTMTSTAQKGIESFSSCLLIGTTYEGNFRGSSDVDEKTRER